MASKFTFRGLMAPAFTAYNKDFSINTSVIPEYAKFIADTGLKGVLVQGTTGESVCLSVQERKTLTEEWVKAVKTTNQHLMVQIGGCPLPDVIELAKHAEKVGVDSLLTLPDLYFKPNTAQDLIDYLKIIAAAAPKTPLLYYHTPARSGVDINMEEFLLQSVGKISTFAGIKYSSTDLDGAYNALKAHKEYTVMLGKDALMAAAFTLGFDTAVVTTLTIIPQYGIKIFEAIKNSKVEEARKRQEKLTAACKFITKDGTWVPTMKIAMNSVSKINFGLARAPLKNLTPSQAQTLEAGLKAYL